MPASSPNCKYSFLGHGVGIPVINILEFHLSTVPGSQTDLVLHPNMEGESSTTKVNAKDVCFPTLDYPGLRVNLVLNQKKFLLWPTAIRALRRTERTKVTWQSHIKIFVKNKNKNKILRRVRKRM